MLTLAPIRIGGIDIGSCNFQIYTLLTEGISAERVKCLACCRHIYATLETDFDLERVARIPYIHANLADKEIGTTNNFL
jgi:hypothetical protein